MTRNTLQKLELTWIGKGEEPKLEPRILIENPEYSYGDNSSPFGGGREGVGNMLILGDNLLALKALEQDFAGKVKCIYIDPPYNTGNAFEHYDDGVEHSLWLNLISQRIKILYKLLSKDGVLFVNIDEIEHAYLKVLLDEIFGRKNFIGDIIWKKRKGGGNDSRFFAIDHDYIIVFAKEATKEIHRKKWRVSQSEEYLKRYKEISND
jgi:adenine-specific DNA-methyltransferase